MQYIVHLSVPARSRPANLTRCVLQSESDQMELLKSHGSEDVVWHGTQLVRTPMPCQQSGSSLRVRSAVSTAEVNKSRKYSDIVVGVDFVPVAIETSGVWGEQALELITEIGRRIAAVTYEPRSTSFLRQRISVAVQRGNAFCVLGTFQQTSSAI